MYDLIIIGAGPTGLACAIEAKKAGLNYLVIEKGGITDAIRRFPVNMTFFSTPELLELDGLPFTTVNPRPNRVEALQYYRHVVRYHQLHLKLHTRVNRIQRQGFPPLFQVQTQEGENYQATVVVIATGYFDFTNRLQALGEDLPHVHYYYHEPFAYAGCKVVVIGGRNSAVETALDLYRHGAQVTLIHRGSELGSVKYWMKPDIENRIKEGSIKVEFNTVVKAIYPGAIEVWNSNEQKQVTGANTIAADFVFALIGYRPDADLLRSAGIQVDPQTLIPAYHPETYESNVPGLYLAGSVACGCETWNIFIENGRAHAQPIIEHISRNRG